MNKLFIVSAMLLLSNTAFANGTAHWGYEKNNGPAHWSEMNPDYALCGSGKNQSPVNINRSFEPSHKELNTQYQSDTSDIINNGHSIQINMQAGSTFKIDNKDFQLKQFHFHSPSENTINGKSFPLEVHFVHADKDGNLAVLAVMFEIGDKNTVLEKLWNHMPEKSGDDVKMLNENIIASNLIPGNRDYYHFTGSLTTPPCSEGVSWYVLKNSVKVSQQQVEKFSHVMHHANNRPVQRNIN